MFFHLVAVKIPSVKARAKAANIPYTLKGYLKDDSAAIMASILTVIIGVYVLDELLGYRPSILKYLKFFFIAVGFMGSSVLIALLGKATKAINSVVDAKTNELDDIKK